MRLEQAFAAIRFAPTIPTWMLAALAGLCVLAVAVALWRRARGWWLRGLCFAVVLLWLAGPRLVRETREALPDIAVMVVDKTASMDVGNRAALRDAAAAKLAAEASTIPDLELRTITVPEGGHDGTRLFTALDRALADIPRARLGGIVMLTDGQVHDIPATAPNVPVHVLIPAQGEQTDRRVRIVEAPSYGIVGHSVTLKVAVDDLGVSNPSTADLTIRRDGEPAETQTVPVNKELSIDIPITRGGPTVIELSAAPLPGEVSDLNNHAVIQINGVRDRLRVLLVSGEPHAGERTWRRLLKADPAVDLVHFTILRPPEKDDMTPLNELALIAFPVRELFQIKIKEFDLIILDRFSNRGILPAQYLRNIADYVRNGGGLLLSVGPEFSSPASLSLSPLAPVLPAEPISGASGEIDAPFRPLVTPLGERHPVTAGLPRRPARQHAEMGRLVSPPDPQHVPRPIGDERPGWVAIAATGPCRRRPHRAAALGPNLAMVPRPRGRRPASRIAAPGRALADEGARARGRSADRPHRGRQADHRTPHHQRRPGPTRHRDRTRRRQDHADAKGHHAGPRRRQHGRTRLRRLAGQRRRTPGLRRRRLGQSAGDRRSARLGRSADQARP